MNFSEMFKGTRCHEFSPSGKFLATTEKYRLFVRNVETLEIVQIFTCLDTINRIQWSSDSKYILAVQSKRRTVQVFCPLEPKWSCKIDEGVSGLSYACFAPDARHVLTLSNFSLRLTIWSLVNKSVKYIKQPKCKESSKGMHFSHDGKFLAILERREYVDYCGVYSTENWELVRFFELETEDALHVLWSPDDRFLAAWDSSLDYNVVVYQPTGKQVAKYVAYEHALGIKTLQWSPCSQFLAIGSFDQTVRIFSALSWKSLAEHTHVSPVASKECIVYSEQAVRKVSGPELDEMKDQDGTSTPTKDKVRSLPVSPASPGEEDGQSFTEYCIEPLPFSLACKQPALDQPNPKIGIGTLKWSFDDNFLMTINDNMEKSAWIWDMKKLRLLAVVSQIGAIKSAEWSPTRNQLALSTSHNKVYLWTPEGSSIIKRWNSDGNSLVLADKDSFSMFYLQ